MCRNIKRLRHADHPPTDRELHDAALQFIRKISWFRAPSRANQDTFDAAVDEVARRGGSCFGRSAFRARPRHRSLSRRPRLPCSGWGAVLGCRAYVEVIGSVAQLDRALASGAPEASASCLRGREINELRDAGACIACKMCSLL